MGKFNFSLAASIHLNKYDYSLVQFKNVDTKVKIVCPIHGAFFQSPYHHVSRKQGCKLCKGEKIRLSKHFSYDTFVARAQKIHNYKYSYPKLQSVNNAHHPIEIICHIHGIFKQNFNNHIYNKCGCPDCGYNVSQKETEWLDSLNIPKSWRQRTLTIKGKRFKVDALDMAAHTVYEYFGYFWHGHPKYFQPDDVNPRSKQTFGQLYQKTLQKIDFLESNGFIVIQKWG